MVPRRVTFPVCVKSSDPVCFSHSAHLESSGCVPSTRWPRGAGGRHTAEHVSPPERSSRPTLKLHVFGVPAPRSLARAHVALLRDGPRSRPRAPHLPGPARGRGTRLLARPGGPWEAAVLTPCFLIVFPVFTRTYLCCPNKPPIARYSTRLKACLLGSLTFVVLV